MKLEERVKFNEERIDKLSDDVNNLLTFIKKNDERISKLVIRMRNKK